MAQLHHHPDGLLYVRGNDGRVYSDTAENFAKDFGEASVLPPGVIERLYDDGERTGRHHLFDAAYNQVPGSTRQFKFGDRAIQGLELLLKRQAERKSAVEAAVRPVPAPPVPPRNPSQFPVVKP